VCPKWERGVAWALRKIGSARGRGVREGRSRPPRSEGDKESVLNEGRDNMDKDEEE
jgi:hypothetical protein